MQYQNGSKGLSKHWKQYTILNQWPENISGSTGQFYYPVITQGKKVGEGSDWKGNLVFLKIMMISTITKPCHGALEQLCEGQNVQSQAYTPENHSQEKKSHQETHSGYERM